MSVQPTFEPGEKYDPKWGPEPKIRTLTKQDKDRGPYPLIDSDPHFWRVLRYMRYSDVAMVGGSMLAWPTIFALWERNDPSASSVRQLRNARGAAGFLGLTFGFLYAYQTVSLRFWGWTENERERRMDFDELTARARAGLPLYGESTLEPYMQKIASNNSTFAALKFNFIPWFNFVNHNDHGVDVSKYYARDPVPEQSS